MSLLVFRDNMVEFMSKPEEVGSIADYVNKFVLEYDLAMKRGGVAGLSTPVSVGNISSMKTALIGTYNEGMKFTKNGFPLILELGPAMIAYWTGAIIPGGSVANPGSWNSNFPTLPVSNPEEFMNKVITAIQIHLPTISGNIGAVIWSGYIVPPMVNVPISFFDPETIPDDTYTVEYVEAVVSLTGNQILNDGVAFPISGTVEIDEAEESVTIKKLRAVLKPDISPKSLATPEVYNDQNQRKEKPLPIDCDVLREPLNYSYKLSTNFNLANLSTKAIFPHKIKSQAGLSSNEIVCNLKNISTNVIEPILKKYPNLTITSGFRGKPSLSGRISQHEKGEAVDLQFLGFSFQEYFDAAQWIVQNVPYDQFIFEHGNSIWFHISLKKGGVQRYQTLTMYKKKYQKGIKLYYS